MQQKCIHEIEKTFMSIMYVWKEETYVLMVNNEIMEKIRKFIVCISNETEN